ncbi:5896_t:CDS:2, partial [Acaulospora morrowiae]
IFAGNRDEHLNRPTSLASWWHPDILSGLDLQRSERGTWLGMSRTGRFAAVTNYREPEISGQELLSRGALVKDLLLESDLELEQRFNIINKRASKYGGFNLISADLCHKHPTMLYLSNRKVDNIQHLNPKKFYGLSNSLLEDQWPKVKIGVPKIKSIVEEESSEEKLVEELLGLLSITVPFGPTTMSDPYHLEDLKRTIRVPKYDFGGDYATRTST